MTNDIGAKGENVVSDALAMGTAGVKVTVTFAAP